jgi:glycosyltransferase involved in cell wall biosynthesis
MKLIYVGNARFPSEKAHPFQIVQMCQAFRRRGADVTLVYPSRKNPQQVPDILSHYGIQDRFIMRRLFSVDFINAFPAPWQRLPFLFHNLTFSCRLCGYLLGTDAQVIYTRDISSLLPILKVLPERYRGIVFLEIHKLPAGRFGRKMVFQAARKIGGVVTVTAHLKEEMVAGGVPDGAVLVAHDGVDLARFDAVRDSRQDLRKRLGLPPAPFLAGYLGRFRTLDMEKGLGDMIRALAAVRKTRRDVEMCFVGGPLDDVGAYRELASSLGLDPGVLHFFDHVPPSRVPAFQKAFDACLIPFPWTRHFAYNASPMKLFEYMASGNPIIATELPSTMEVLAHEKNALLTPPEEPGALAAAILRLRDDRTLAEKLAARAARDVLDYTWEARAGQILDFVRRRTSTGD